MGVFHEHFLLKLQQFWLFNTRDFCRIFVFSFALSRKNRSPAISVHRSWFSSTWIWIWWQLCGCLLLLLVNQIPSNHTHTVLTSKNFWCRQYDVIIIYYICVISTQHCHQILQSFNLKHPHEAGLLRVLILVQDLPILLLYFLNVDSGCFHNLSAVYLPRNLLFSCKWAD